MKGKTENLPTQLLDKERRKVGICLPLDVCIAICFTSKEGLQIILGHSGIWNSRLNLVTSKESNLLGQFNINTTITVVLLYNSLEIRLAQEDCGQQN